MWIEDGNCMPGEAKWAIFPPISSPPFPLPSSDLCLLIHEGFVATFHTLVWRYIFKKKAHPERQKKGKKQQLVRRGGELLCCLMHLWAVFVEETQPAYVIKTQSQLAIPIHILTCIPANWCWYIQGPQNCLLTSQFRTAWSQQRLF